MLSALIPILVLVIFFLIVWYAISIFVTDARITRILGLLFALVILVFALDKFGYHF